LRRSENLVWSSKTFKRKNKVRRRHSCFLFCVCTQFRVCVSVCVPLLVINFVFVCWVVCLFVLLSLPFCVLIISVLCLCLANKSFIHVRNGSSSTVIENATYWYFHCGRFLWLDKETRTTAQFNNVLTATCLLRFRVYMSKVDKKSNRWLFASDYIFISRPTASVFGDRYVIFIHCVSKRVPTF